LAIRDPIQQMAGGEGPAMQMAGFILPHVADADGCNDQSYPLSLVRSFQKLPDTVPLLSLERHSPQDAASLPLPLRASTIAIACHRASLASKIELTSALLQVGAASGGMHRPQGRVCVALPLLCLPGQVARHVVCARQPSVCIAPHA
jgi:hypothetical protein